MSGRARLRASIVTGSSISLFAGGLAAAAIVLLALADGGFQGGTWAAATILVWWTVVVALLAGAWPRSPVPVAATVAGLCLLGLTALTAASIAWTVDLGAAYVDAIRAAGYLGLFVLAVVAGRAGAGRALLTGLAAGLVVVAALALVSRLEPGFVGGSSETLGLEVSGGRLSYPLGYWNGLGACMAAALLLLAWLGAGASHPAARALAVGTIPVPLLALFFSGSRGAAVAAGVGLVVLLIAGPRRSSLAAAAALGLCGGLPLIALGASSDALMDGRDGAAAARAGDELLFVGLAVCAVLAVVAWKLADRISTLRVPARAAWAAAGGIALAGLAALLVAGPIDLDTFDAPPESAGLTGSQETTRFASVGGSGRAQYWEAAVDATRDEPLRGVGAGAFESYWNRNGSLELSVEHAHSLFLESSAELGIGGLILALGFFAAPAVAGVRRLRASSAWPDPDVRDGATGAALAVLAAGFVTANLDWVWDLPAAFAAAVVSAGLLVAPPATPDPARRRSRRRVLAAAAVVVIGLVSCVAAAPLLLADEALEESRAALAAGDPDQAAEEADRAIDLLPFAAEPRLGLAEAERARRDYPAARRALDDAQERSRGDWRLWFVEAGLEFEAGRAGPGIYALNHARALNPKAPQSLFAYPTAISASD